MAKKYIPAIPNFHILVFTLSIAAQFHFIKKTGYSNDLFSSITKFLLGETEMQSKALMEKYKYRYDLYQSQYELHPNRESTLSLLLNDRHRSCIHKHSCLNYVLKGFFRPFLIATGLQLASKTLLKPQQFLSKLSILVDEICKPSTYRMAMFTGLFSSVFKVIRLVTRLNLDLR